MRSIKVLLLLISGVLGHANYSACPTSEKNAEDIERHECRACSSFSIPSLDAHNCPPKGYECDESLLITRNVLSADDQCTCAYLRCADSRADIAVDGAVTMLGKVFCKARKWTTSHGSEVSSFVCARKCGLGVCGVLPRKFFEDNPSYGPLVISPPDAEHPCAWATCQLGAVASNGVVDLNYDGLARFSCAGDRTWTYTGPGAEQKQLKSVRCRIKGLFSFTPLTLEACKAHWAGKKRQETCSDGIVETADSITCPTGFYVLVVGDTDDDYYDLAVLISGKWIFKYVLYYQEDDVEEMESDLGGNLRVGCSTA